MVVETQIGDGKGSGNKADVYRRNGDKGLKVFTDVLHERDIKFTPAFNPTFGVNMAINAAFGGTPVRVHDGLDTTLWTGSQVTGNKTTFNSTDVADVGSQSVKTDNAAIGDIYQFTHSTDITVANYQALSIRIYVDKDWTVADEVEIYAFDDGTATQVSTSLPFSTYFNETDFDTWQSIIIPLSDFEFTAATFDAFRIEQTLKSGKAPLYYLDEIIIQETNGAETFVIEPEKNTKIYITSISLSYIDALDTTLASNSMQNLSYNKILGVNELANGINFRTLKQGVVTFSSTIKSIGDSLKFGGELQNHICDGTNTLITIDVPWPAPVILDSRSNDCIEIIISDDLSGLLEFTVNTKAQRQFV